MENQNNNNLSELDQLKAQYETLKQQFDQQEIVNDRLMKSSIKHSTARTFMGGTDGCKSSYIRYLP